MSFVKILFAVLVLLIIQLQYRLWFGDGNVHQVKEYQQRLELLAEDVKEKKSVMKLYMLKC